MIHFKPTAKATIVQVAHDGAVCGATARALRVTSNVQIVDCRRCLRTSGVRLTIPAMTAGLPCPNCGAETPSKTAYAIAQLAMGNTIEYTCKSCGRTFEVTA